MINPANHVRVRCPTFKEQCDALRFSRAQPTTERHMHAEFVDTAAQWQRRAKPTGEVFQGVPLYRLDQEDAAKKFAALKAEDRATRRMYAVLVVFLFLLFMGVV